MDTWAFSNNAMMPSCCVVLALGCHGEATCERLATKIYPWAAF